MIGGLVMEFRKCMRCGCFFASEDDVCINCRVKDNLEINILNNYIEENNSITNIHNLSIDTGIAIKNINRFIEHDALKGFNNFQN